MHAFPTPHEFPTLRELNHQQLHVSFLFARPWSADTHSPGSLITGSVTDVTLPAWDTPKNKRRPLITPGNSGRRHSGSNGGGGGGPAADTPDVSPLWGGRHDGASPALSAITAADISPYHVEDATLHTPGGGRRGGRHGVMDADDTREEEMDISSAARDLREFKAGAGGARAPSSADVGHGRTQGLKSGRGGHTRCWLERFSSHVRSASYSKVLLTNNHFFSW